MKKAILFDMDGTLIDSSEGIVKSIQYALSHLGIQENDIEKLKSFIGPLLKYSFVKYYGFDQETTAKAISLFRDRYQPIGVYECSLYPHVKECLSVLKEKGYQIAITSSKPEQLCKQVLSMFDIAEFFDEVVGSSPDCKIESKEEVLLELMRRFSTIEKSDMCLIGDTVFDVEGANQVGIDCIGVRFGFGDVELMKQIGAKFICDDLLDLPELIEKL